MWRRWLVGYALGVTVACAGGVANMATLWFDDFESGNPLSTSYSDIYDAETNATCGRGGGWGCRGAAGDPEYGEFYYTLPVSAVSDYFRVTFDVDSNAVTEGGEFIALSDNNAGAFLQLARESWVDELGSPWNHLTVKSWYSQPENVIAETVSEVMTPGDWQTVVLEVWFSTGNGLHQPPDADGRVQVTVDNVVVINATNCMVISDHGYHAEPNELGRVYLVPGGNGDNFGIYDEPPVLASTDPSSGALTFSGTMASVAVEGEWVNIADWLDVPINSAHFPGGQARVLCELWAEAGSPQPTIQARLYNGDDGVSVGESAVVASSTPASSDFAVTLTTGTRRYRLQVTSDTVGVDLFCIGAGLMP